MDAQSTQQHEVATVAGGQPQVQFSPVAGMVQPPGPSFAAVTHPAMGTGYQNAHHPLLMKFWNSQMLEIEQVGDFKTHQLPLARIKKIMKADEDVKMIAAEAPVLFAKACEMFILELTLRSWIHTEENKRRTLQKNDIAAAITRTDIFDFLVDIVPRDDVKEEALGMPRAGLPVGPPGGMYYMAQPHQASGAISVIPQAPTVMMASPGIIVGRPAAPVDPAVYRSHAVAYAPQQTAWQQHTSDAQKEASKSSS